MKRLLGLLLLLAAPAFAQTDMVGSPCNMTDGSCAGILSSFVAPAGCVSTSVPFFGTDLKLRCGVFTDDPTTGTISAPTVSARNVTATALATPGAITVTNQGTPGGATVTYKLVALLADGTTTEAGAASSTATSNATLSATNFNRLAWSAVTGATSYRVYRTVAPTTPATTGIVYSGTALTVDDTGLAGGGETAPTVNGTGQLAGALAKVSRLGFNPVTTAQRDAIAPTVGDSVFNSTTNRIEVYGGAAWQGRVGVLAVNTTSQATTGTSEEVLATYTLPANTLSADGKAIRVTAVYVTAANGNTKTGRIRIGGIGGTALVGRGAGDNGLTVKMTAIIVRTGSNAQVHNSGYSLAGATGESFATLTVTDTAAADIVVTGTTATSAGDMTFKMLIVEALN